MDDQRLLYLIDQYKSQKATPEEREELDRWYAHVGQAGRDPENPVWEQRRQRIWRKLMRAEQMAPLQRQRKGHAGRVSWLTRTPVWAAAILLMVFGGLAYLYYAALPQASEAQMTAALEDVTPGGNKAILTLSDGATVDLNQLESGQRIERPGLHITKSADGLLTYQASATASKETTYHTITTPRGGQYQIVLPDGTLVWLNAESKLKYPAAFRADHREVELSGEAYFEVAKHTKGQKRIPFVVKTQHQEVQVLGTHFNIKAYEEEEETTTTLLEGKVRVVGYEKNAKPGQGHILQVGQAARLERGQYEIEAVDVERAIAWKNGKFIFSGENIKAIMNNIARWYDVRVEFQGDLSEVNFEGSVSRYENIVEVLRKLELTGTVHFKVVPLDKLSGKERRIIVMP